uniref:Uncharacterized protein n=1 Tax=Fagus sylvatica TaxID=28930 RepID=A0A2N9EQD3_FAGSY
MSFAVPEASPCLAKLRRASSLRPSSESSFAVLSAPALRQASPSLRYSRTDLVNPLRVNLGQHTERERLRMRAEKEQRIRNRNVYGSSFSALF